MRYALILLLLLVPLTTASTQHVALTLTEQGVVREDVTLSFNSTEAYDVIQFRTEYEPLAVIHEDPYTITQAGDAWMVELQTPVQTGENTISFALILSEAVREGDDAHVFNFAVTPVLEDLIVELTLPPGNVLAETDPAASPQPNTLTTDGRQLTLTWQAQGPLGIIVLYEDRAAGPSTTQAISFAALALLIISAAYYLRTRKTSRALRATLTSDEQTLVDAIRDGAATQKELVKQTGWTKSKMSKVVRRLEEKAVVEKEPHMRTNKLTLTRAWK